MEGKCLLVFGWVDVYDLVGAGGEPVAFFPCAIGLQLFVDALALDKDPAPEKPFTIYVVHIVHTAGVVLEDACAGLVFEFKDYVLHIFGGDGGLASACTVVAANHNF